MLDQKLIRENPTSVEENLSLRGKVYNISHVHELTVKKKEIDIEISSLQSESKKLSKLIGQEFSKSQNNDSQELNILKKKGNYYRTRISEYEEKKRILDTQILLKSVTYQISLAKMHQLEMMKVIMYKLKLGEIR